MKTESSVPGPAPTRRAGVRRTAWLLAACALASYLVFLISVLASK